MEINFSEIEEKILSFWKENKTFEKSISQRKKAKDFVFFEGPPTANGKPGIHHVEGRAFKDIICRYKTMQGFRVLRKAGWDTHGLPVELEVEKKLGLKNKKDIDKYGIAEFNQKCRESVWQYKDEWEKMTTRIGFWLDMKNPYITYQNEYIETLWWIVKQIHEKGLLYRDYRVVPYCPRCGTPLSSHEVAQGYKKIKEPAIYIKFKINHPATIWKDSYLLIWTTTPWTLPGNVAVAVNPNILYAQIKIGEDYLILAKDRIDHLGLQGDIIREFKGETILGLEYEPLFQFTKPDKKAYFVVAGKFVSLEEGTGLVHIAPAFGEDDMQVGKANNLPVILNVDGEGKFKQEVTSWAGTFVKEADPLIVEELQKRGVLFKEELYEHDYPFCWRCNSPLLYYAKESWFVNMQKVKKDLIASNEKINWVPPHLKEGRFGEWLKELKDWAFSRERYWGTPLPIWQCKKCGKTEVVGSRDDLLEQKFSTNQYYILRHGQTKYQVENKGIIYPRFENPPIALNEKGEAQIKKAAKELKDKKIDLIYSSDFFRTRQTAGIVAEELGVEVNFDERLRDINLGVYHGGSKEKFYKDFPVQERFQGKPEEGESWNDCRKRLLAFMEEIDKKHQGKRILIVSHGDPLWLLDGAVRGRSNNELLDEIFVEQTYIGTGEWRKIDYKKFPYDREGNLDFHRPFVDEVKFACPGCHELMQRTPELADVWFDSGSMPFAQYHYPFKKDIQFPADYISEAIDQTRGWFYTLLAVATLLGKGAPYKNVVSLGHVLDQKGEKMSKSKGNIVDPWYVIEKYGADAVRWYFYTVNQPGDAKLFSEKEVESSLKKFIMTYWNSFVFFETYAEGSRGKKQSPKNILDKWVTSKLNSLINEMTQKLDKYDITSAARMIENFVINDLSLWYIRRSRKRFVEAQSTLGFVLSVMAKLTAPFVPFLSEEIYARLAKTQTSVHLADWPKADKKLINKKLEGEMQKAREVVSSALAERAKAGVKVRQPLQELQIADKVSKELLELIKEEINVKKVTFGKTLKLNAEITPALKEEGMVRETIRQIQDMRKKEGLKPQDKITIQYFGTPELNEILARNKVFILKETKAQDFNLSSAPKVEQKDLWLEIKKL